MVTEKDQSNLIDSEAILLAGVDPTHFAPGNMRAQLAFYCVKAVFVPRTVLNCPLISELAFQSLQPFHTLC